MTTNNDKLDNIATVNVDNVSVDKESREARIEANRQKAKHYEELMDKRGYILMMHTFDYSFLSFATKDFDAPIKLAVQILVETNNVRLFEIINPGLITVSTEYVSGADDDKRFKQFEGYIKLVLEKIKK